MTECSRCGSETVYVAMAFGYVCATCGALSGMGEVELDNDDDKRDGGQSSGSSLHPPRSITAKQVASAVHAATAKGDVRRSLNAGHVRRLIDGITAAFDCGGVGTRVDSLLVQWSAVRSVRSSHKHRTLDTAHVVAACFAVVKKEKPHLSIGAVSTLADVSENVLRRALLDIETTLAGTGLLEVAKDTPGAYIERQIDFLVSLPCRSPPMSSSSSKVALRPEEKALVSSANPASEAFRSLADRLTGLCVRHGLYNRSAARGQTMDLGLCSFAILMHCIEAQAGKPCNEGRTAELAVFAPGWRVGQKMAGYAKLELDQSSEAAGEEDGEYGHHDEVARSTVDTIRETVKRRYVEISRLLTLYVRALPWYDACSQQYPRGLQKSAGRSKVDPSVKADITSIRPLPRKVLVRYTKDVLLLVDLLHEKVFVELEQIPSPRLAATPWSRFWTTELHFNNVRQTASGQEAIKRIEFENRAARLPATNCDQLISSIATLTEEKGVSTFSSSLDARLLTDKALEQMSGETADRLLFLEGEMESYIRTSEEIEQRRQAWLGQVTPLATPAKRTRPQSTELLRHEESLLRSLDTGKRTRALEDADVERILSQL